MEIEKGKVNALKVLSDPRLRRSPICINLYHPLNMQYVYEYVYVCGGWEGENKSFKNGDWERESECFKSLEWP